MAKTKLSKYDVVYPEKNILSALRDLTEGKIGNNSFLRRALVVEIDHVGGKLEEIPVKNPKNSIRARIISEPSPHTFLENKDLPVFYPLFPYDIFPLKETEHVYVLFDGVDHGLWVSRIAEPFEVDDRNITPGIKKFQINNPNVSEQQVQDLSSDPEPLEVSAEFQEEKVPKFTARKGDRVIEGSNNTLIILGRDRVSDVGSGQKDAAGTVHVVVGRKKEEDLDIENDLSTIVISMNTDVDDNFLKNTIVGSSVSKTAAIGVRSDEIRIVARKGMKIVVEGGDLIIEAKNISFGKNASDTVAQVNKVKAELDALKNVFNMHIHTTTATIGPTAVPGIIAPPTAQMSQTQELGSKTVKVKD